MQPFKIGDRVKIIDSGSHYHLTNATIKLILKPEEYLVVPDESGISVFFKREKLIKATKDPNPERFVQNLYSRYAWVRFNTLGDVLEAIEQCEDLEELRDHIVDYIGSRWTEALPRMLDHMQFLPHENKRVYVDFINKEIPNV